MSIRERLAALKARLTTHEVTGALQGGSAELHALLEEFATHLENTPTAAGISPAFEEFIQGLDTRLGDIEKHVVQSVGSRLEEMKDQIAGLQTSHESILAIDEDLKKVTSEQATKIHDLEQANAIYGQALADRVTAAEKAIEVQALADLKKSTPVEPAAAVDAAAADPVN